jgi:hypothetical protein
MFSGLSMVSPKPPGRPEGRGSAAGTIVRASHAGRAVALRPPGPGAVGRARRWRRSRWRRHSRRGGRKRRGVRRASRPGARYPGFAASSPDQVRLTPLQVGSSRARARRTLPAGSGTGTAEKCLSAGSGVKYVLLRTSARQTVQVEVPPRMQEIPRREARVGASSRARLEADAVGWFRSITSTHWQSAVAPVPSIATDSGGHPVTGDVPPGSS